MVSAISLNQIKVVFNKAVETAPAETISNYKLNDSVLTGANTTARLLPGSDNKVVIINLDASTYMFNQNTLRTFSIDANRILERNTGVLMGAYSKEIAFSDNVAPKVEKVDVTGNSSIRITFSEAVMTTNASLGSNYLINGNPLTQYGGSVSTPTGVNNRFYGDESRTNQVTLNFANKLPAGANTLTVGVSTVNRIMDTTTFALEKVELPFTVADVTVAPRVVGVVADTSGTVTVQFSEKIKNNSGLTNAFRLANGSPVTGARQADNTKVQFNLGSLSAGANVLEIAPNQIEDIYGNLFAPDTTTWQRVSFEAVRDTEAPTVSNVYAVSETVVRVVFSEAVRAEYLVHGNFILKDSEGKVLVGGTGPAWGGGTPQFGTNNKTVNLTLSAAQAASLGHATYTLEVKSVADVSQNIMTTQKTNFVTIDSTDPSLLIGGNNLFINLNNRTAKVMFNEPMNQGSIGTVSNYLLAVNGVNFTVMPTGTVAEVASDSKSVTFTFPAGTSLTGWDTLAKIRAVGVKDAAGNTIAGGMEETTAATTANLGNFPNIVAGSAKLFANSSKTWITFETDQQIVAMNASAFVGNISGATVSAPTNTIISGKLITLEWTDLASRNALRAAGDSLSFNAATYAGNVNSDGAPLTISGTGSARGIKDNAAPLKASSPFTVIPDPTNGLVKVTFNEALVNTP